MEKIIFILLGVAFLAGCNEQEVVQPAPAVAVAPASEKQVVHNEQITIPDRAISKKTGDGKY